MKIAFIQNKIENSGGVRISNEHISILKKYDHTVDVYSTAEDILCEEWLHPLIPFKERVVEDKVSDLSQRDFSQYDLIVSDGLSSLYEVELIQHGNTIHFCQMYDKFIQPQYNDIIDRLYNDTTFLVYSESLKKILKKKHDCQVIKIPSGIHFEKLNKYKNLNKDFSKPILCFMASFYNVLKDIPLMQDVFKIIQKLGWKARLITTQEHNNLICDEFFHNPPFEEKCKLIAESTVMLHTSKFETWCLAIGESMCLGTPVVGVNSHGPKEYATDENCVLIEDRDPQQIVDHIISLYDDKLRYYNMVENGFETMKKLDWGEVEKEIEKTYFEERDLSPGNAFWKPWLKQRKEYESDKSHLDIIQIGAHTGKAPNNPLLNIITRNNLKSILVEPLPDLFGQLKNNYKSYPKIVLEEVAIADQPGLRPLFYVDENYFNLYDGWADQLGSFSKDHILKHKIHSDHILSKDVVCIIFLELLEKHKVSKLDWLFIDVEGYDFELIKSFQFDYVKPQCIFYEHLHLSKEDKNESRRFLESLGYEILLYQDDTLAYLIRYFSSC